MKSGVPVDFRPLGGHCLEADFDIINFSGEPEPAAATVLSHPENFLPSFLGVTQKEPREPV